MSETGRCELCPQPIDLATRHVTIIRSVETERRGEVTVHDDEVMAQMHLTCAERLRLAAEQPAATALP